MSEYLRIPKNNMFLVAFASGLYPFLHFYNGNLSMADSSTQCLMLAVLCFLLPLALIYIASIMVKIKPFNFFSSSYLSIINLSVFSMLLVRIIFHLRKEMSVVLLIIAIIIGFVIHKHLKKVVIIQLMLAIISLVTLTPKMIFALKQNNDDWDKVSKEMLEAKLIDRPNIFVIQPDGYVNSVDLKRPPYEYDNSEFEAWLSNHDFKDHENFRSNYYSTLTSNSSMFAMKHHYYSNTNPSTLKTHNANNVIIGNENNVLKILKNNQYQSYLITDNTYFLSNRRDLFFDYTNVPLDDVYYFNAGDLEGVDLLSDFTITLDTLTTATNFFFIEKTIPAHIAHSKRWSHGDTKEKMDYLDRLNDANSWLKSLITTILKYDENAMIVIVADHGGYVGLDYTSEINERQLSSEETISSFSSILSIKWPKKIDPEGLNFKTNVNLFRNIFYSLSKNDIFLKDQQENISFIPFFENGKAVNYKVIDENRNVIFLPYESQ